MEYEDECDNSTVTVIRVYEFYDYTGEYDPESHKALDDKYESSFLRRELGSGGSGGSAIIGNYVGSQRAALVAGAGTQMPTTNPVSKLTRRPTKKPISKPSRSPTKKPRKKPSKRPTKKPLAKPSGRPTKKPLAKPSRRPTKRPRKLTRKPTRKPIANFVY